MAKKSSGENGSYERMHFSATKTWQHARDIFVQVQSELQEIDLEGAAILKNHVLYSLENAALRIAHSVNCLPREQKKHFFHSAIENCVAAQNHILLAQAANLFDLTAINDELTILIRQIAANIGHLNENNKANMVDNPS